MVAPYFNINCQTMFTVLLNMHMCEFLQETEDKGDHSSPEGDSDTEGQSTVAGILYIA